MHPRRARLCDLACIANHAKVDERAMFAAARLPCIERTVRALLPCWLLAVGCSSALDAGRSDAGVKLSVRPDGPAVDRSVDVYTSAPIGWASVNDLGQDGTTGGGDESPSMAGTLDELTAAAMGTNPAVIQLTASMEGSVRIGSNKTIQGMPGVVFTGHFGFSHSANVILRNLTIVGNDCTDVVPPATCQEGAGADAVTISTSHHIWVDHCDISDGSDGNLDIVSASDYVTVSWTKFWYRGRPGDHQFSNLIGSSDGDTGDAGHLRVTFHHDWWGDQVVERMPRARFGQIHLFNNLYTAAGSLYCVGVGVNANMLLENNAFIGVRVPVDVTRFVNAASVAVSYGNLFDGLVADHGTAVFTPPYPYTIEPATDVQNTVSQNAGPK
jgi:pectate lyase